MSHCDHCTVLRFNTAVYWYTQRLNREIKRSSLDALTKDCLNDVYASAGVVVGVLGIAAGYPVLDPLAGGIVGVLVLYQGIDIARENTDYLIGTAAPTETYDQVRERVLAHPAIHGVHDLRAFYMGQTIEVELHAEIDDEYTLQEAHEIETDLRDRTRDIPDVDGVHIHLDPSGMGEWKGETESSSSVEES